MPDTLSPAERSRRMGLVRGKHTSPEVAVRSIVHRLGYRYALHAKDLPGAPDLVFRKRRRVIFVHGCFWHRHSKKSCRLARLPKSRLDFWLPKLESNQLRDMRHRKAPRAAAWPILVVWQSSLRHEQQLAARFRSFLPEH